MTTGGDRSGSGRRSGVSEMWRDLHVLLHVPRNVQDSRVQGLTCVIATCEGEPGWEWPGDRPDTARPTLPGAAASTGMPSGERLCIRGPRVRRDQNRRRGAAGHLPRALASRMSLSEERTEMSTAPPAVHQSIVCVDVERFTDRQRTRPHQLAVRRGMYHCLETALERSGVPWHICQHEDRGDGVLVLVPSQVPKELLVEDLLPVLAAALAHHNQTHEQPERFRLRLAVHAGEVQSDEHGVVGAAINLAFRLLDAKPLKRALAGSSGGLAVIASRWFFDEVIRQSPASAPASYRRVRISVKKTKESAWIRLLDGSSNTSSGRDSTRAGTHMTWLTSTSGLGALLVAVIAILIVAFTGLGAKFSHLFSAGHATASRA